jgi:hypothetical protein
MKADSIGFEIVNQIDGSGMGRIGWEPVVVPALMAIRVAWQRPQGAGLIGAVLGFGQPALLIVLHEYNVGIAPVHPVQHQTMQLNVQIGRRAKALDQCYCPALPLIGAQSDR